MRIQQIRDAMAGLLADEKLASEERKGRLAQMKNQIEVILDLRDERERAFIEQELQHHQLEQELEQEIEADEARKKPPQKPETEGLQLLFRARPFMAAGAEQLRKTIEENRKELNEDEQFSTILINNSERENIPSFVRTRKKKEETAEQAARIDTIVVKQREIGMMYKESQELQESQLKKVAAKAQELLDETEFEDDLEEDFEATPPEQDEPEDVSEEEQS
jgi:hypothetical protein